MASNTARKSDDTNTQKVTYDEETHWKPTRDLLVLQVPLRIGPISSMHEDVSLKRPIQHKRPMEEFGSVAAMKDLIETHFCRK